MHKPIPKDVQKAFIVLQDYFKSDLGFSVTFNDGYIGVETTHFIESEDIIYDSYIVTNREFHRDYDKDDEIEYTEYISV
jgi:hypothetical protein